ncbi:MAG: hypothetical protein IPK07_18955 [Deltaproteobacteria bacterium]|nr:hypothetical protein [Deltaproteobacteria bacterium]
MRHLARIRRTAALTLVVAAFTVAGARVASAASGAPALGSATGRFTFDGKAVALTHAYAYTGENLFDAKKKDTFVVVTDRALPADQAPDDEVQLHVVAREGGVIALRLRIADGKAAGVALFHPAAEALLLFPAQAASHTPGPAAAGEVSGHLKTPKPLELDGHAWSADLDFHAAIAPPKSAELTVPPAPAKAPPPEPEAAPAPRPKRDPRQSATEAKAIVAAIMTHDSARAVKYIQGGMDPNARDENGLSVLNWAVMSCDVPVVKALVDKGADVNYQRMPGYTMLTEAGACPAAEKILRAAGAK